MTKWYRQRPPCLVEGCDRLSEIRSVALCLHHAGMVWNDLVGFHAQRGEFADVIADLNEQIEARRRQEHETAKAEHMARLDGDIYFVRIGGLVKVGWTRDLRKRIKSYGASAEVLAHYPATRDDETTLHRQLSPARAKGREWYHDGPVIQDFVTRAFAQYGATIMDVSGLWTEPKRIVAGKRHR